MSAWKADALPLGDARMDAPLATPILPDPLPFDKRFFLHPFDILNPMRAVCEVRQLGMIPYAEAWQLQERLAGEIARRERFPTLLLLEHPHTYTFGRRGHPENLLWDEPELKRRGISVYWVDRGGDVTYHGPGQLVGYPLLPLAPGGLRVGRETGHGGDSPAHLPQADYVGYVRRLEAVLILALARLGLPSLPEKGLTGVWVQPQWLARQDLSPLEPPQAPSKIAAIGIKVDARGVSRHGFALNVDPDMVYWEGIIGCGLKEHCVARLADLLDPPPAMPQVIDAVIAAFAEVFDYEIIEVDPGPKSATFSPGK
jgi:lipoyl(octanoyl) transferase